MSGSEMERFNAWYATPEAFKAGDENGWRGIAWAAWRAALTVAHPEGSREVPKVVAIAEGEGIAWRGLRWADGVQPMDVEENSELMTVTQYGRIVAAKDAAHRVTLEELHALEVTVAKIGRELDAQPARQVGGDEQEIARVIDRLESSDPDFDDCADAVSLIKRLAASPTFSAAAYREALIGKVVGLCNRIPGATTWNAAEFMYDELSAALAPAAVVMPEPVAYMSPRGGVFEAWLTQEHAIEKCRQLGGEPIALLRADEVARLNRNPIPEELLERLAAPMPDARGWKTFNVATLVEASKELRALLGKEGEV